MDIKNRIIGGLTGCTRINRGVIGIQGQQGCNRYYHPNVACTGVTDSIKTENEMNIYNFFSGTGVSGESAISTDYWTGKEYPTHTYADGYFDESLHGSRNFTVTSDGIGVGFTSYNSNNIQLVNQWNSVGYHTMFSILSSGKYEISYQILIKEPAIIGTRIVDNFNNYTAVVNAENASTEYAATVIRNYDAGNSIYLELFSNEDTPVTLKGGVGAFIMIKLLYEY